MYKERHTLTEELRSQSVSQKESISAKILRYITGEKYSGGEAEMTPLEIISRLCSNEEELSGIVKKQQKMIERSKVEEEVKEELRNMVNKTDGKLDVLEYHMRHTATPTTWDRSERSSQ